MLIYEKKVEENSELVRHLFGTEGNVPSADDVQLSYKDESGSAVSGLTVNSKLLDDGHGGIKTEDGDAVQVWLGDTNIIPGGIDAPEVDDTDPEVDDTDTDDPSNTTPGDGNTTPEGDTTPETNPDDTTPEDNNEPNE